MLKRLELFIWFVNVCIPQSSVELGHPVTHPVRVALTAAWRRLQIAAAAAAGIRNELLLFRFNCRQSYETETDARPRAPDAGPGRWGAPPPPPPPPPPPQKVQHSLPQTDSAT